MASCVISMNFTAVSAICLFKQNMCTCATCTDVSCSQLAANTPNTQVFVECV